MMSSTFQHNENAVNIVCVSMVECFTAFDQDADGLISLTEFHAVCNALFRNDDKGHAYSVPLDQLEQIFNIFDQNNDSFIDREEFQYCWDSWITTIVRPKNAFLVVDMQNDFISGSLALKKCGTQYLGETIISPINRIIENIPFDAMFFSQDWHPSDHMSFIDNIQQRPLHKSSEFDVNTAKVFDTVVYSGPPPMKQRLWPRHCVQNTWGAEMHKDLKLPENAIIIYKGCDPDIDSYSMFWDNMKVSCTQLEDRLKQIHVSDVYVCGIAYDFCVGATALNAISAGYRTILVDDCSRGVSTESIEEFQQKFVASGGLIVQSDDIKAMIEGRDRRPELAIAHALKLGSSIGNGEN